MFEAIPLAPPDPILGLTEAFRADPRPNKINLGVGVFQDATGVTPILECVRRAERLLWETETSKSYFPIDGLPEYGQAVRALLLGDEHPAVREERARTSHTLGGTGALRVAADLIHTQFPQATVWMSDPTWENHPAVFSAASVPVRRYRYFDAAQSALLVEAMLSDLEGVAPGDVVLLHGCCHNPTGVDPSGAVWGEIGRLLARRGALPLVDLAYQGFGDGLVEDTAGLRTLLEHCDELLVCSSFSKTLGLYRERVGALTAVARTAEHAQALQSQIKVCIRRNYSNPAAHGGEVVRTILRDPELRQVWYRELGAMRDRLHHVRRLFGQALDARGIRLRPRGNGFIVEQKGMFSFSGLTPEQVAALRDDYGVYVVGSGRMNVAGITEQNVAALVDALAAVLA